MYVVQLHFHHKVEMCCGPHMGKKQRCPKLLEAIAAYLTVVQNISIELDLWAGCTAVLYWMALQQHLLQGAILLQQG